MSYDNHEPQQQAPGVPSGREQPSGPRRANNVPSRPESSTTPGTSNRHQPSLPPSFSPDELRENPVLLAQVTSYLQENHLHLPMLTPDIEEMKRMKRETPELYRAYVKAINSQIEADFIGRTAPYREPGKIAHRGQLLGFLAVVSVLVFCGYLASLGHIITAGIIATFDLVALAAVFASGNRPKQGESADGLT